MKSQGVSRNVSSSQKLKKLNFGIAQKDLSHGEFSENFLKVPENFPAPTPEVFNINFFIVLCWLLYCLSSGAYCTSWYLCTHMSATELAAAVRWRDKECKLKLNFTGNKVEIKNLAATSVFMVQTTGWLYFQTINTLRESGKRLYRRS